MAKALRTQWYEETANVLQINGKSKRSQECCARAVRMLIEHFGREPNEISEEELRDYFLYRKNDCKWAPDTMKICHCGIRFFCEHVIRRDWHIFNILKSEKERRIPCVISRKEVYAVPNNVRTFHNYTCLVTVYACGFRRPCTSKPAILTKTYAHSHSPGQRGCRPLCAPARRNPASASPVSGDPPESPGDLPGFGSGAYVGSPL